MEKKDNLIIFEDVYSKKLLLSSILDAEKRKELNSVEPINLTPYTCRVDKLEDLTTLNFQPNNSIKIDERNLEELIELLPYLKNVDRLEFVDVDSNFVTEFLERAQKACPYFFKQIKILNVDNVVGLEYLSLPNMPNLKQLTVKDNVSLKYIVIPEETVENVEFLLITSNPELQTMPKLSDYRNLKGLDFFGNTRYSMNEEKYLELISAICMYPERSYNLDVLYYKDFYNYFMKAEHQEKGKEFFMNSNWCELLFPNKNRCEYMKRNGQSWRQVPYYYTSNKMQEFHEKCLEIVDTYTREDDSELEKYAAITRWMWENIKYVGIDSEIVTHLTNGSINAIINGECVCQGFTRANQYLASLVGIKTYELHCDVLHELKPGEEKKESKTYRKVELSDGTIKEFRLEPHSMTQGFITRDGKKYQIFTDVTWDAAYYKKTNTTPYFLVNSDIFKDERLFRETTLSSIGMFNSIFPMLVLKPEERTQLIRGLDKRFDSAKNTGEDTPSTGSKK